MSESYIDCLSSVTISLQSNFSALDYSSGKSFSGSWHKVESKTCYSESASLYLFDAIFVLRLSTICIFQKAMKLQKTLAYPVKLMYLCFRNTSLLYGTIKVLYER